MKRRILWITPRWPVPESDGARVATAQALRAMAPDKFEVTLLAVLSENVRAKTEELREKIEVGEIRIERRAERKLGSRVLGHLWNLLRHPRSGLTFSSLNLSAVRAEIEHEIRQAQDHKKFDAIIFDGLHAAALFDVSGRLVLNDIRIPVFYRAHNVEADIWWTSAQTTKNPFLRAFFRWQALLIERFERSVALQAQATFSVSEEDELVLKKRMGARYVRTLRIGMEFDASWPRACVPLQKLEANRGPTFGFLGSIDWHPNREGLTWLMDDVWPEVRRRNPLARIRIAGSGHSALTQQWGALPGVEFLGYVPDLKVFYDSIDALLVPIFSGSGTRVKAIAASRYGCACIGTELGMAGMKFEPGHEYIRVQMASEWIEVLSSAQVEDLSRTGERAWKKAKASFDARACAQVLVEELVRLTPRAEVPK